MAGHSHWAGIKHKKDEQINNVLKFFLNSQKKLLWQLN